jgi:hypothetical protein
MSAIVWALTIPAAKTPALKINASATTAMGVTIANSAVTEPVSSAKVQRSSDEACQQGAHGIAAEYRDEQARQPDSGHGSYGVFGSRSTFV